MNIFKIFFILTISSIIFSSCSFGPIEDYDSYQKLLNKANTYAKKHDFEKSCKLYSKLITESSLLINDYKSNKRRKYSKTKNHQIDPLKNMLEDIISSDLPLHCKTKLFIQATDYLISFGSIIPSPSDTDTFMKMNIIKLSSEDCNFYSAYMDHISNINTKKQFDLAQHFIKDLQLDYNQKIEIFNSAANILLLDKYEKNEKLRKKQIDQISIISRICPYIYSINNLGTNKYEVIKKYLDAISRYCIQYSNQHSDEKLRSILFNALPNLFKFNFQEKNLLSFSTITYSPGKDFANYYNAIAQGLEPLYKKEIISSEFVLDKALENISSIRDISYKSDYYHKLKIYDNLPINSNKILPIIVYDSTDPLREISDSQELKKIYRPQIIKESNELLSLIEIPKTIDDIELVALMIVSKKIVGQYNSVGIVTGYNGSQMKAYKLVTTTLIYDPIKKKLLRKDEFLGGEPPKSVRISLGSYNTFSQNHGTIETKKAINMLIKWILD